jgi:hypothetical protein
LLPVNEVVDGDDDDADADVPVVVGDSVLFDFIIEPSKNLGETRYPDMLL